MSKHKNKLICILEMLLALGSGASKLIIVCKIVSSIAKLTKGKKEHSDTFTDSEIDTIKEILTQAELSTGNAAAAAASAEQIKELIKEFQGSTDEQLEYLTQITEEDLKGLNENLNDHGIIIDDTNIRVRGLEQDHSQFKIDHKVMQEKIDKLISMLERMLKGHEGKSEGGNITINVGGNFIGGDYTGRDKIGGDKVEGDKVVGAGGNETVCVIHNIPSTSLREMFKGRENDFAQLVEQLDGDGATAITQAIAGLGGMGKTRLAIEYGWYGLNNGTYEAVLWVNCSQEGVNKPTLRLSSGQASQEAEKEEGLKKSAVERLCVEVAKLGAAHLLDIEGIEEMKPGQAVEFVLKELRAKQKWLVVFDNVDETEMAGVIGQVLPGLSNGKVIITSRLNELGGGINKLSLEKISDEAAIEYLYAKTEGYRPGCDNDAEMVKKIAEKLDGLPVALEQAGAYIRHKGISFEEYLKRLEEAEERVLKFDAKAKLLGDYDQPVMATWQMTVEQLSAEAKAVINLASLLAPEDVPERLFVNYPDEVLKAAKGFRGKYEGLDGDEKADIVEEAIAELGSYSMISRNTTEGTFGIHRMVQEVTRLRLLKEEIESFMLAVLDIIANDEPAYETKIKTNYEWSRETDKHINSVIAYAERLWPGVNDIPEEIASKLTHQMNELALFYKTMGRYTEAEPLLTRALEIDEKVYGKDHPTVAIRLNNLANLYRQTGRFEEAGPLYERAIEIGEKTWGDEHPNVAVWYNNLAGLYRATGRYEEAEPLYKRAIEIGEKTLEKDHPDVATRYNNLALLYKATGRMKEAEPLYEMALKIDEKVYGKEHPEVATDLNNLAGLYQDAGRLKEAEPLYERVLEILKKFKDQTGYEHPNFQAVVGNYRILLKKMGVSGGEG